MKSLVIGMAIQLLCWNSLAAHDAIRVGLFHDLNVQKVDIVILKGTGSVKGGDGIWEAKSNQSFQIRRAGDSLELVAGGKVIFRQQEFQLSGNAGFEYRLRPEAKKSNQRIYRGKLVLSSAAGKVRMVMEVDTEDYVAGVIEAESGKGKLLEYYKVQAVISRTYALNNLRRHLADGFEVCDGTHCQVFHGKSQFEPLTYRAAEQTHDVVIVDSEIRLITAAFHSNCGGHTVNAEDVWSKPVSYLVGRQDTFCLKMPNSHWEKMIPLNEWKGYFAARNILVTDENLMCFTPGDKSAFFADSSYKIPSRKVREDFKLRSSYFSVLPDGEHVRLVGKGFGHGVGLCQEGAMVMAAYGYTYRDIIHYYYKDVHLIPRDYIRFFEE